MFLHQHDSHLSDARLMRAIDRELSPREVATAEAHLSRCEECRARLQQLQVAAAECSQMVRPANDPSLDTLRQSRARLAATMAAGSAHPEGAAISAAGVRQALAAVAAVAAVFFVVVLRPFTAHDPAQAPTFVEPDALPVAALTPGATWELNAGQLCSGMRATRAVTADMRAQVLREYAMDAAPADSYELDYLITPELGGATDARNLWPQRYRSRTWNAHVKDALEQLLPEMVCRGELDLETAQREMARDWIAAYRRYFHTSTPLPQHAAYLAWRDERDEDDAREAADWTSDTAGPAPRVRLIALAVGR